MSGLSLTADWPRHGRAAVAYAFTGCSGEVRAARERRIIFRFWQWIFASASALGLAITELLTITKYHSLRKY
jgi:hypothetical protein